MYTATFLMRKMSILLGEAVCELAVSVTKAVWHWSFCEQFDCPREQTLSGLYVHLNKTLAKP